jgi:hypothetical protein
VDLEDGDERLDRRAVARDEGSAAGSA